MAKLLKTPCDLNFVVDGKDIRIPAGSEIEADAASNLVIFGGWLPANMQEFTNEWGTMTNGRVVNNRIHKGPTGKASSYESSTYVKAKGDVAIDLAKLGKGSEIVGIGYVNTDKTGPENDPKFIRNLFLTDFAVLKDVEPSEEGARKPSARTDRPKATPQDFSNKV